MKVVAVNASPHRRDGGTGLILTPFLEGAQAGGADVASFETARMDIRPCSGCLHCWLRTPGRCAVEDDMRGLLAAMEEAHVLVFATPLYADGMAGGMKDVVDRCLPMLEPFFVLRDGHYRHPVRRGPADGQIVLVSVCGLPELDNFDPLVHHVRAVCDNLGRRYAGALLRPCAASLPDFERAGAPVESVYRAAREAGRQLASQGAMDPATLAAVSREVVRAKVYVRAVNAHFRRQLDAAGTEPS